MKKKLLITISFLLLTRLCFSAPNNSISVPNSFSANTTISASATNANNNEVQTKFNAHSHTDITQTGTITSGVWQGTAITDTYISGTVLPSGALFFMVTGSCPAGTTDVTATYSNRFVRINATGGTTSGADTHTHTSGAISGSTATYNAGTTWRTTSPGGESTYTTITDHTHGAGTLTSAATASGDNVPAYVTAKACQVD